MTNEGYPSDWEERRSNVLERDNYACRGCGISDTEATEEYGIGLHAHHLTPISEGGEHDLDNLIALCEECHVEAHSKQDGEPYHPIQYNDCIVCGQEYMAHARFAPGYCTELCFEQRQVNKVLDYINNHSDICSTCFASNASGNATCENCGSWEPNENLQAEQFGTRVRVRNLIRICLNFR